jgi:malonyl-CoA O-methyltransferase
MSAPSAAAPPPEEFRLDRPAIAAAFDRASGAYDAAARLQREVRTELLGRLDYFRLAPAVVLDLGAGTGAATAELAHRFRSARVIALDIAPGMLRAARRRQWPWRRFGRVCADAHALPLRSGSVDLVFSSLMLQWSDRPDSVFAECARVLKPGGLLLFSTFGPDTLEELRAAWATVDSTPRVSVFPGMPELSAALQHARLAEPVLDAERLVRHYPEVRALLQELKAIGARNAAAARTRGLTGPRCLARMIASYEQRRDVRGIPATWEIIHGAAFSAGRGGESDMGGEVHVPLSSLKVRARGS